MKPHELKLIIDPKDISERVEGLAEEINRDYRGKKEIVIVGILKGAFIFVADLIRSITVPLKVDFLRIASYGLQSETSGNITITKGLELPIEGKDIIVVEDIVDTGISLDWVIKHLATYGPSSIKVCVFIDKMERRECDVKIDYRGFLVEKGFLVGYGLDYSENYRHLKGIYEVCFH